MQRSVAEFFKKQVPHCVRVSRVHPVPGDSFKFTARLFSRANGRFHILGFYRGDIRSGEVERLGFYDDERGMTEEEIHDRSVRLRSSNT